MLMLVASTPSMLKLDLLPYCSMGVPMAVPHALEGEGGHTHHAGRSYDDLCNTGSSHTTSRIPGLCGVSPGWCLLCQSTVRSVQLSRRTTKAGSSIHS